MIFYDNKSDKFNFTFDSPLNAVEELSTMAILLIMATGDRYLKTNKAKAELFDAVIEYITDYKNEFLREDIKE